MAAKADDPERVDLALRSVESVLDELPSLADDWASLSQDERLICRRRGRHRAEPGRAGLARRDAARLVGNDDVELVGARP